MTDHTSVSPDRPLSTGKLALAAIGVGLAATIGRQFFKAAGVARQFLHPGSFVPLPTRTALLPLARGALAKAPVPAAPATIEIDERTCPGAPGGAPQRVLIVRRRKRAAPTPVVFWIHGGGYLMGRPEMDLPLFFLMLDTLDVTIVSVDYRLAPEHPFPAPLDDCRAALDWLAEDAAALGIDPARIAIGGTSAGGGLAAALVQQAVDAGRRPSCQALLYPMLDDRTAAHGDHGGRGRLVWSPGDNRRGWTAYLGREPGGEEPRRYAVPARRTDLAGLPPAWIGVGSLDLFQPENEAYAQALEAAGVECELDVVPGAYHAFDFMRADAPASVAFHAGLIAFLGRHLFKS